MNQYLTDTEFAVRNLIQIASAEENELKTKAVRLREIEAQLRVHKWDFETSDLNDDFSDAYVMAAFQRMARAATEAHGLQQQLASLQASIGTHQQAIQAISGSILQVAKQGISIVHGGLPGAPEGRKIGSVSIRDIIWQARNQALHFEEENFKPPVINLFGTLTAEQGPSFSLALHVRQSRAKQVVDLLGWSTYDTYVQDMQVLLP
ncbi:hypothetical protein [Burkholderia ambifaria]|uniref:hypothetical protein n=1 Tax=Burkholderia ambifaria TaxID=152480 RepID=UPI001B9DF374|nr:hypothetical protein [Burkholderia ambifaria]MBR8177029.1 hypothetical protein [Burkholderia ambifaria]